MQENLQAEDQQNTQAPQAKTTLQKKTFGKTGYAAKQTREGALPPPKANGFGRETIQAKQRPIVKSKTATPPTLHVVKPGETYSFLAQKYGVTVEQLRAWNGFSDRAIPVGAQLLVSDPNNLTEEEIQDYFNNFNLNDYLQQMGKTPPSDAKTGSNNSPKDKQRLDPSKVLGPKSLGQSPDFRGKQFYNNQGQPINLNQASENKYLSRKNFVSGGGAGSGAVSMWDYAKRKKYIAKVARTANDYLAKMDQKVTGWGKLQVMSEAVDTRNQNRPKARKGLSWGAKHLSENLDQDRSLKELLSKYKKQNPNMSHEELARFITQKSGSTSSALLKFNRWSKVLGPIGTAVGIGVAAYNIVEDPSLETAVGEVMAMLGGAGGFTLGMGLVAMGLGAIGTAPLALIIGAAAGGVALGMLAASVGKHIGRKLGRWLDSLF